MRKVTFTSLRTVMLMVLAMATSLAVNAGYSLRGSFNSWGETAMTYDSGDGTWYVDQAMTVGATFKIYNADNGEWLGPAADGNYWVLYNTNFNSISGLSTSGQNMEIRQAGNIRLRYNPSTATLDVRFVPCPVAITAPSHGTVTVDKALASAGETVTITATPAAGYYVQKSGITVEVTAPAGAGQAPQRVDVGDFVSVSGSDNMEIGATQYTFVMPDNPLGVNIEVAFTQRTITYNLAGSFNSWAGTPMTLDATSGKYSISQAMSANAEFKVFDDVNVWYGGAADPGTNFTVTGQMIANQTELSVAQPGENFTIERAGTYTVTFDPAEMKLVVSGDWYFNVTKGTVTNGDITLSAQTALKDDVVTITVSPALGYVLGELAVTADGGAVVTPTLKSGTTNQYEFTMPADNVTVTATFTADPHIYLVGSFNEWGAGTAIELTQNAAGNWVTTQTLPANAEFKFRNELGEWIGGNGDGTFIVTGEQVVNATPLALLKGDNGVNFQIPQAGTWTLTYNPTGMTLTISGTWMFNITNNVVNGAEGVRGTSLSAATAANGTTVTATVTVDAGYQYEITASDASGNVALTAGANNTYTFNVGTSDVTVTTTFSRIPQLYVKGSFDSWADGVTMTKNAQNKWTATIEMAAGTTFKILDQDDNWYGGAAEGENYWITSDMIANATEIQLVNGADFYMPQAGSWTITVDPETMKMVVSGTWLYNITTSVSDANGASVVLSAQAAAAGTTVTATVTVDEAYELGSVTIMNGQTPVAYTENAGVYTFTMPAADVAITVNVTKIPKVFLKGSFNEWALIEMTKNAQNNWTWTGEMPAGVEFGFEDENAQWLALDAEGENFWITSELLGSNLSLSTTGKNIYVPVAGVWTLTVSSDKSTLVVSGEWDHAITINPAQHGTVAVKDGATRASYQQTVTLVVTPDQDWSFGELHVMAGQTEIAVSAGQAAGEYTFVMPNADVTVTAAFTQNRYNITLTQSADYTIAVEGGVVTNLLSGTEVVFSVTPTDPNYTVAQAIVLKSDNGEVVVTDNQDGTYTFLMPMSDVTISAELAVILQGVVFTADRQWSTYYSGLDLEVPDDVTAYVVSGLNATGDAVVVEEVDYIPANVGVLLYSETPMDLVSSVDYDGVTGDYESALVGTTTGMAIESGYVLYNNTFLRTQAGTLQPYRCYLPASVAPEGAPRLLAIKRDFGVVTGIEGLIADQSNVASVKYVNLNGHVSDTPFNGVNIAVITLNDGSTKTVKMIK